MAHSVAHSPEPSTPAGQSGAKGVFAAILLLVGNAAESSTAEYVKATIDDQKQLHLERADGVSVAAPLDPVPYDEFHGTQVAFGDPKIAHDGGTVGWLGLYDNCCQSYPIPLTFVLFKEGKIARTIRAGLPIWRWDFIQGTRQVVFATAPTHGDFGIHYELHDTTSGKLLAEHHQDSDENPANLPKWARSLPRL